MDHLLVILECMTSGGWGICHNVQIAVNRKKHIVVAVDIASEA